MVQTDVHEEAMHVGSQEWRSDQMSETCGVNQNTVSGTRYTYKETHTMT